MDRHQHWQRIYTTKREQDTSWFEAIPAVSLRLMEAVALTAIRVWPVCRPLLAEDAGARVGRGVSAGGVCIPQTSDSVGRSPTVPVLQVQVPLLVDGCR